MIYRQDLRRLGALKKTQQPHTVGADTMVECRPEMGLVHSTILLYCQLCHSSPVNGSVF